MTYPDYSCPRGLLMKVGIDALVAHRRCFRLDALACVERLNPPVQILGEENIPQDGPYAITVNHYHRESFGALCILANVFTLRKIEVKYQ